MSLLIQKKTKKIEKKNNLFLRFSSMGIQMAGIIAFFAWLGTYFDKKFQTTTPWWTLSLSLFGVISSMFLVIREILKLNKPNE
jgi:F0F1-type ATP synthase assembly protein I